MLWKLILGEKKYATIIEMKWIIFLQFHSNTKLLNSNMVCKQIYM